MSAENNKQQAGSSAATSEEIPLDAKGKPITGKALRLWKRQKEAEEKERKQAAEDAEKYSHLFGVLPLMQSQTEERLEWTSVGELGKHLEGKVVRLRARMQGSRAQGGKLMFLTLRESVATCQATVCETEEVPKAMVGFAGRISKESLVVMEALVEVPPAPIASVTQSEVELKPRTLFVLSTAEPRLPILVEDCERSELVIEARNKEVDQLVEQLAEAEKALKEAKKEDQGKCQKAVNALKKKLERTPRYGEVSQANRLDYRVIDIRTVTNQAIFRISTAVGHIFRSFCFEKGFTEIHSPKLLGAASEGGASVFKLEYFNRPAFLAQSPQLYKQMSIAGDMPGVFEVGPVFRAENSNTHRHLCEFTGMDMEMPIRDHYHEVLEFFGQLFFTMFSALPKFCAREIEAVRAQYPFEDFKFTEKPLILHFKEGIQLLRESGVEIGDTDDIDTTNEKRLGAIIREKYGVDFYMLDKFPLSLRPFYTMPDPHDNTWSNSYDFFMRGEEILSGAQRIHEPELLVERATEHGVELEHIKPYIDAFRYGCPPHAGGGIGLERVVMLYLGLGNIRRVSLFPRDPSRLTP